MCSPPPVPARGWKPSGHSSAPLLWEGNPCLLHREVPYRQEIKTNSFLDCLRFMVHNHPWRQVCLLYLFSLCWWGRVGQGHPSCGHLHPTPLWAAARPLFLLLERLLSQLRVRRKGVPKLYNNSSPGLPRTHPLPPFRART